MAALRRAAVAAQEAADYLNLGRLARKIQTQCEANGDNHGLAWGLYYAAAAHFQRGDGAPAEREYRKARQLFEECDDREGAVRCMLGLAAVAVDTAVDAHQARLLYEEALPLVRQLKDQRRLAIALGNLAEVERLDGDPVRALKHAREALAIFEEIDDPASVGWQLTNIAHFLLLRRMSAEAVETLRDAYAALQRDPIPRECALYFDVAFIVAAALRSWDSAARLLAFTNHFRDVNNAPRMPGILPWFSLPVERLSTHVDADRLHDLFGEGEALDMAGAQELVEGLAAVAR